MKQLIRAAIFLLLLILTSCSELPEEPTKDEVLRDAQILTSNIFLGEAKGVQGKFPISSLIIEEMEVEWVKENETLHAEITAFFGDKEWKSGVKQTITVRYVLNASGQWEARGVNVNNPVISVIPRE